MKRACLHACSWSLLIILLTACIGSIPQSRLATPTSAHFPTAIGDTYNLTYAPPQNPISTNASTDTPIRGIKSLYIFNCIDEQAPIEIWIYDGTLNSWTDHGSLESSWNDNTCPGTSEPFIVDLTDGHAFILRTIAPIRCEGQNDPTNGDCEVTTLNFLFGDANGLCKKVVDDTPTTDFECP